MLKVKLSGALRDLAGRRELLLPLPPSRTLGQALAQLENDYPGILGTSADYQWRHGSTHVVIAVNGKVVEEASGDLLLQDGDELSLLPPLGGGAVERMLE
ncbi:MAG: MoaD/ThiS family protein [Chloroflexi bacterium]|nr:MoaD/ThiS family protein [Chloroflexota bacterium]MCL5951711.1 MoaD/ThiS family protein [Chloroflexota bacterium]